VRCALFFETVAVLQFWLSGLRAGLRGKSIHSVLLMGLFLIFVAYLSGSFSPRHPRTVALDIGLSGVRITLVLLNLFWIQELLAKEIDRKSVLFSLTYPVSRQSYLIGRYLSVLTMSALATAVFGLALVIAVALSGGAYQQEFPVGLGVPLVATLAGQFVDVSVVAAFALLVSTASSMAVMSVGAGLAFAVAGKALGATIDYLAAGADNDQELVATYAPVIDVIRWLLPDLSRLDWRTWPLYGALPEAVTASLAMAGAYATIMLALASWTIRRREFS